MTKDQRAGYLAAFDHLNAKFAEPRPPFVIVMRCRTGPMSRPAGWKPTYPSRTGPGAAPSGRKPLLGLLQRARVVAREDVQEEGWRLISHLEEHVPAAVLTMVFRCLAWGAGDEGEPNWIGAVLATAVLVLMTSALIL